MPDILIRDVEMPDGCFHCFAVMEARNDYDEPTTYCTLTKPTSPAELHKVIDGINHQQERMWFCPLVELPPHGDLILKDDAIVAVKLLSDLYPEYRKILAVLWDQIKDLTVIIPEIEEVTNDPKP